MDYGNLYIIYGYFLPTLTSGMRAGEKASASSFLRHEAIILLFRNSGNIICNLFTKNMPETLYFCNVNQLINL